MPSAAPLAGCQTGGRGAPSASASPSVPPPLVPQGPLPVVQPVCSLPRDNVWGVLDRQEGLLGGEARLLQHCRGKGGAGFWAGNRVYFSIVDGESGNAAARSALRGIVPYSSHQEVRPRDPCPLPLFPLTLNPSLHRVGRPRDHRVRALQRPAPRLKRQPRRAQLVPRAVPLRLHGGGQAGWRRRGEPRDCGVKVQEEGSQEAVMTRSDERPWGLQHAPGVAHSQGRRGPEGRWAAPHMRVAQN